MSDVYVIEVGDEAVGIVARDEDGTHYRFHAAIPRAFDFEGRIFLSPDDAHEMIRKALTRPATGIAQTMNEFGKAA